MGFCKLMDALARHAIPFSLIPFPAFVKDPDVLFAGLSPCFPDLTRADLDSALQSLAKPEMIHDFSGRAGAEQT